MSRHHAHDRREGRVARVKAFADGVLSLKVAAHERLIHHDDRGRLGATVVRRAEEPAGDELLFRDLEEVGGGDAVLGHRKPSRILAGLTLVTDVEVPAPVVVRDQ